MHNPLPEHMYPSEITPDSQGRLTVARAERAPVPHPRTIKIREDYKKAVTREEKNMVFQLLWWSHSWSKYDYDQTADDLNEQYNWLFNLLMCALKERAPVGLTQAIADELLLTDEIRRVQWNWYYTTPFTGKART